MSDPDTSSLTKRRGRPVTTPSSALLVGSSEPATSPFPVVCASSNVTERVATSLGDTSKRRGRSRLPGTNAVDRDPDQGSVFVGELLRGPAEPLDLALVLGEVGGNPMWRGW